MPKFTTKRPALKFRKLTIEVEESVAARLEALAGTRAHYMDDAGAVAAEVVTFYLDLLEEVETATAAFRQGQYHRARKNRFQIVK